MKKKGINNITNGKGGLADGQTWRRLKRFAIVVFENLLAWHFSKFILVVSTFDIMHESHDCVIS